MVGLLGLLGPSQERQAPGDKAGQVCDWVLHLGRLLSFLDLSHMELVANSHFSELLGTMNQQVHAKPLASVQGLHVNHYI